MLSTAFQLRLIQRLYNLCINYSGRQSAVDVKSGKCFRCNESGHIARNCPK